MNYAEGSELMLNALKGFHGRFKILYGQMALRLNDSSYIMTDGNKALAGLGEESIVVCDINTGDLGGIFRRLPEVNALIFGLTADMVNVSDRTEPLRVTLEDLAQLTGPELTVLPDTDPAGIISALHKSSVCLIKNTGAISAGSNLRKAVAGIQIVEKACEAEIHGKLLGGTVPIPYEDAAEYNRKFKEEYVVRNEEPFVPFVGYDETEFSLRSQLIEYGKDLVRSDLSYGSWGNLSVRLNEDEMLITPSSMDYFDIKVEDIVRMNIHSLEYGEQRIPSGECAMHASIYREFPERRAVIHTHSNGVSVFAACEAGFALTDKAMRDIIGNICVTRLAHPGTPELARAVTDKLHETHAVIIPHHGAVFTGSEIAVTFAVANAVEMRARNLLRYDQ